ncbi:cell division protein PerM [Actinomyces wuliandei]|uniref:cell division protein PerM n=1 Tax=Actinomyces wuliandei TaxID=2057743 RepID=UPI00111BBEEB|nr:DUF6350 family protein [Actinomyces wuliandei]
MSPRRLRPDDWGWALRAGVESAALGWVLVVLLSVLVFLATSSLDATAALTTGDALRTGTALWSLGFGGSLGSPRADTGLLSLPLTGLTLAQAAWTWSCVRRADLHGPVSGAWTVVSAAVVAGLASLAGPPGSRTWPAVLGLAALTAVVVAVQLQRRGRGSQRLSAWWDRRPHWVSPGLSLARGAVAALAVLTAVVLVVALVSGAGRASRLHDTLAGGGIASTVGLLVLQAGWLPTVGVWACSWLVGSGFSVGTGSMFSPERVAAGPVPSLPLLGLLPTAPVGRVGLYLPLVVTAAAMVVAWRRRHVLSALRVRYAVAASLLAGTVLALTTGVACLAASGSVGPGRMADVGPQTGYTVLLVFLEVSVGLGATAVLTHPYTRTWATEAVSGTTQAASDARHRVEARLGSAVGSGRYRHASRPSAPSREHGREEERTPQTETTVGEPGEPGSGSGSPE